MSVRKIQQITPIQRSDAMEMLQSNIKYNEIFKPIQRIQDNFNELLKNLKRGIEAKAEALMKDVEQDDDFLVPEVPKPKREVREKRESRVTKKTSVRSNVDFMDSTSSSSSDQVFRRSARVASKMKTAKDTKDSFLAPPPPPPPPTFQSFTSKPTHNIPMVASPSMPPVKIRRTDDTSFSKPLSDSLIALDMKGPLGSSTPTDDSIARENVSKPSTPVRMIVSTPKTTPACEINRQIKGDSVKKRVEEFEKKAAVSKLPIATPDRKKINLSPSKPRNKMNDTCDSKSKMPLFADKDSSAMKGRCTRNTSKILQEKTVNIKLIEEKGEKAQKKKEVIMKASAEEAKRKREERSRKVAAQREAVEKEKLEAALKMEKEKEEKMKIIQKQKEDKLRNECLKKKQAAALKAAEVEERRRKEEALKAAKLKEAETKLEDYGIEHVSDDVSSEEEERPKKQIPSWALKENRKHPLKVQAYLNKKRTIHPWFYNEKLRYPKLEELFSCEVKMRPRTSSMYWNTMIDFDESFPLK